MVYTCFTVLFTNRPIKTDKFLKIKIRNCLLKKRVFITSLNTLHISDV